MIVCIHCSAETKAKMDGLLRKSSYKDYSELVEIAVENLAMLELEVAEKGALVIGEGPTPSFVPGGSPPLERVRSHSASNRASVTPRQSKLGIEPSAPAPSVSARIPDLFLSGGLEGLSTVTVSLPPVENAEKSFTLDRWLFGQYNKILPAKANCRALLRLTVGLEKGISLQNAAALIAEAASRLGDYLADRDRCNKIGRDDSLATAFPGSGRDGEKGRARYVNQFLGSVNSQGLLSGLLWDYRLVALAPDEEAHLLLTEPAVHFARLPNPVLDERQAGPAQKFSSEETAFLLEHIWSRIPVESFAFRTLIRAISNGADTPDKLDEALRSLVPTDPNRSLSTAFLTSQRSGALSRMADLGLITRARKGVRVSYVVTEQGQQFIEFFKENTNDD
jgi:hypothetical protein